MECIIVSCYARKRFGWEIILADVPAVQIVKIIGDNDGKKMKYDISGFPTLLLLHDEDETVEFNGTRCGIRQQLHPTSLWLRS